MLRRTMAVTLAALALSLGRVHPVEAAYIDPNSGGMLFHLLAGILAVLSSFVLFFSRQIKRGLARLRRSMRRRPGADQQSRASLDE